MSPPSVDMDHHVCCQLLKINLRRSPFRSPAECHRSSVEVVTKGSFPPIPHFHHPLLAAMLYGFTPCMSVPFRVVASEQRSMPHLAQHWTKGTALEQRSMPHLASSKVSYAPPCANVRAGWLHRATRMPACARLPEAV
eukprot:scaffold82700_cov19-Tisochrysis_lutea.AAC.2